MIDHCLFLGQFLFNKLDKLVDIVEGQRAEVRIVPLVSVAVVDVDD